MKRLARYGRAVMLVSCLGQGCGSTSAAGSSASGASAGQPAGSGAGGTVPAASGGSSALPDGGVVSSSGAAGTGPASGEAGAVAAGGSNTGGASETAGSAPTGGAAAASGVAGTAGTSVDCEPRRPGYDLVWSDEFDYDGLPDPARWGYEVGGHGWGNNELQYYTDSRLENASVSSQGGLLTITARREAWESNQYTSAKLNSAMGSTNPGAWNQGLLEIRARLPAGRGTWPAFWMMPNDCVEGWPNCGEIDIMEHVGYDAGWVYGTIHTDAFNHVENTQIGDSTFVADATEAFHTYALQWTANRLEWSVDGNVYQSVERQSDWGFAEWPFDDKPFHLKLNIAIGGSWGGVEGVDDSIFPVSMELDYVCVYQASG